MSLKKAEMLMERFCKTGTKAEDKSTAFLKDAIISGECRNMSVQIPPEIHVDGLPNTFS